MARDDERELIVVEKDGGGGLKWLLLGAVVGAGLALLFAPRSGKEMRRNLGKGLQNLRDMADETLDEFRGERGDEEHELRSMADQGAAYEDGDHEVAPIRRKERPSTVSAREELERRLAAARARRREIPVDETADDEEPVA